MKIRTGFVSNSSSSSFMCRGIRLPITTLAKYLNVNLDILDPEEIEEHLDNAINNSIDDSTSYKIGELTTQYEKDYFSDIDELATNIIIGCDLGRLSDGVICDLPELDDEIVKDKIEKFLGFRPEKLTTFVQMISNDNY